MLKAERTGLDGPDDFVMETGFQDDGEQWGGSKILKVLQAQSVIDAVVIVSRWSVLSILAVHVLRLYCLFQVWRNHARTR